MTTENFYSTTVEDILKLVFPLGTRIVTSATALSKGERTQKEIPALAADIFAFCGYLIQLNGLMGYFEPNPRHTEKFKSDEMLKVVLTVADRKKCQTASEKWRSDTSEYPEPPEYAKDLWASIYDSRKECIRIRLHQKKHVNQGATESAPEWWNALFRLLIIADEACDGIGHFYQQPGDKSGVSDGQNGVPDLALYRSRLHHIRKHENEGAAGGWVIAEKSVSTLCLLADRHVVCVQPKGRVAQVGCSIRNLSRNLALTGPVGSVRCNWQQLSGNPITPILRDALNILLVPSPHRLRAKAFKPKDVGGWGLFDIDQHWINPGFRRISADEEIPTGEIWDEYMCHIHTLIDAAKDDCRVIDAIVFPELSLTYGIFHKLFRSLTAHSGRLPELKFMIAGTKGNCESPKGNHVMTAINEKKLVESLHSLTSDDESDEKIRVFSQRKHHRWKINDSQIASYGLGSSLSPSRDWWEDHSIETRELNFFQLRRDTVIASLICEDLARNDPCHDIMRSVAPNLVFALLMDGPQLPYRWPARYASTLAEDPGSTVVTLTSYGLVDRSNDQFPEKKSHSVGLIRDGRGTTKEITLPPEYDAVLLTLGSEIIVDRTIDGRETTNASEWYYISQRPIRSQKSWTDQSPTTLPGKSSPNTRW